MTILSGMVFTAATFTIKFVLVVVLKIAETLIILLNKFVIVSTLSVWTSKYLYLSPLSWSKTTLIASCVGRIGQILKVSTPRVARVQ